MNQPTRPDPQHAEEASGEQPATEAPPGEVDDRLHRPARRSESEALGYGPESQGSDPFAALSGAFGAGAGFDMGSLLAQAQQMQTHLATAKAEADATECEGESGGGAVVICATGDWDFTSVKIKPEAIDPKDPEMLEDLILAALRDLSAEVADLHSNSIDGIPGLGGIPGMPGMPG